MMQFIKWNKILILYHALAWLGYCCVFYLINGLTDPSIHFGSLLLSYVPIALVFYFALFMFNRFLSKQAYFSLFFSLFLFDLLIFWISHWYFYGALPWLEIFVYDQQVSYSFQAYFQNAMLVILRFTLYAFTYYLFIKERESFAKLLEANKMRFVGIVEKLTAENKLLLAENNLVLAEKHLLMRQLSPHIFHNMMNGIYAKALANGDAIASDIVKLDHLVSQYLVPIDGSTSLHVIEKEARCIKSLIDLCCGYQEKEYIHFTVTGVMGNQQIPSMALVTLVENVIKYGVLDDPACPAIVTLNLSPNRLEFRTENTISTQKMHRDSRQIGLKNVERRMNLFYADRYHFTARKLDAIFQVKLIIKYKTDS